MSDHQSPLLALNAKQKYIITHSQAPPTLAPPSPTILEAVPSTFAVLSLSNLAT